MLHLSNVCVWSGQASKMANKYMCKPNVLYWNLWPSDWLNDFIQAVLCFGGARDHPKCPAIAAQVDRIVIVIVAIVSGSGDGGGGDGGGNGTTNYRYITSWKILDNSITIEAAVQFAHNLCCEKKALNVLLEFHSGWSLFCDSWNK